jgi:hypothetical protein
MTQQQVDAILEECGLAGIEADAYGSYSGRGMFGAYTLAVTVSDRSDARTLADRHGLRMDSLGLRYIIY